MFWVDKDTSTECQLDVYQESLRDTIREKKKVSTGQESSKNQFLSHFFNVMTGALPFN